MRKPTLERFAALQARVDEANTALAQARGAGATDRRVADLTEAVRVAEARIRHEVQTSDDPTAAAWYARHAAEDTGRETKPLSIGDRVAAATAQRREAQAARRRGTAA